MAAPRAPGAALAGLAGPLLVLLSAGLYARAFPPAGSPLVVWAALAPFFAACALARPGRAALLGALWGVAMSYTTAHWLPAMLRDFFATGWWVAWSGFAAVAVCLSGLYHALFAALLSAAARRGRVHPLAVGLVFAATEWARSTFLVPTPWALSAYSQHGVSALVQSADLAGPYGIGVLVGAANAALAGLAVPALRARRPLAGALGVALLALAFFAYGALRLRTGFAEGEPVRVALVVPAIERAQRFQSSQRLPNLRAHLELTRRAAAEGPALVFWPEFAVPFGLAPEQGAGELFRASRELAPELLVGALSWRAENGRSRRFNSIVLFRDGQAVDRYDKLALMPFSETRPFGVPWDETGDPLAAGEAPRPLATRALRVGVLICSEAMLPGQARSRAAAGAEILANPSNDDWFADEGAAALQLVAAAFRAVENRRYLVRIAVRGESGVVDAHGRFTARAGPGEVLLTAEVHASRAGTPYQLWGDAPTALAGAAAGLWLLAPRRRGGV